MKKIIANRVGAESYSNYTDDQLLHFNYEGTIRRTPDDTLRSHSRASLSSRASDLSYQHGYAARRKPSTEQLLNVPTDVFNETGETASLLDLPTPPSSSFKTQIQPQHEITLQYEQQQIEQRNNPDFGLV